MAMKLKFTLVDYNDERREVIGDMMHTKPDGTFQIWNEGKDVYTFDENDHSVDIFIDEVRIK